MELLRFLLGRRSRYIIKGNSMAPLLRNGEGVLADPTAYAHHFPRTGDIVVAHHPFRADLLMIKRVAGQPTDGSYELRGDNSSESTDSRVFGPVRHELILGRVVSRCPAVGFAKANSVRG